MKFTSFLTFIAALLLSGAAMSATTTYAMKLTLAMPKGSAAEKLLSTQPVSTKLTPCTASKLDAITITMEYNAGAYNDKDVYIIFYNPESKSFFTVVRSSINNDATIGFRLNPYLYATGISPTDTYRSKVQNTGGALKETLFGETLIVDYVPTGTWLIVGIVADSATVNFVDSSTWEAWDVATVIIGTPWSNYSTCTP